MKKIVKNYLSVMGITMVVLLVMSACGESKVQDTEEISIDERETLNVSIDELTYDDEIKKVTAEFMTNLPYETEIDVILKNSTSSFIARATQVIVEKVDPMFVVFEISDEAKNKLIDDDYSVEVIISVNPNEHKNVVFYTDERVGGGKSSLLEEYEDSELIEIEPTGSMDFTIKIKSNNTFYFENELEEIVEEEEVEVEEIASEESDTHEFEPVTFMDLSQRYEDLYGEEIEVSGKVTQVIEYDEYAFSASSKSFLVNISNPDNYDANESIWVEMENPPIIIQGSQVNIKGILFDPYPYESVSGQTITVPYILASSIITQ